MCMCTWRAWVTIFTPQCKNRLPQVWFIVISTLQHVSWSENALKSFLLFYCQICPPVHLRCLKLNLFHGVKRAFIAVQVWKGGINCQYDVFSCRKSLIGELVGRLMAGLCIWLTAVYTMSSTHVLAKKDGPSHALLNDSSDNRTRLQQSAFSLSVTQAYNFKWMQHKLQHDSAILKSTPFRFLWMQENWRNS